MPGRGIGEPDRCGVAPGLLGEPEQQVAPAPVALRAVEHGARIVADRIPGVPQGRGAAERRPALAADPERRMRLLHRMRQRRDIGELRIFAGEARRVLRPDRLEHAQIFVRHPAALLERRQAHRLELLAHPPHAAADRDAPAAQLVRGRQLLRRQHRIAVRQHHDGGDEPRRFRDAAEEGEQRDHLQRLARPAAGEAARRGIGVSRFDVARDDDMVRDRERPVAEALAGPRQARLVRRIGERPPVRNAEAEIHACPPFPARRRAADRPPA